MQFSRLERITARNHTFYVDAFTHWIVLLHLMVLDSHISKWHIGWICPTLHTKALNESWPHLFILGNWVNLDHKSYYWVIGSVEFGSQLFVLLKALGEFGPAVFILRHWMHLDHISSYWGIWWIWTTTLHTEALSEFGPRLFILLKAFDEFFHNS